MERRKGKKRENEIKIGAAMYRGSEAKINKKPNTGNESRMALENDIRKYY
jgi:hypothetical protein